MQNWNTHQLVSEGGTRKKFLPPLDGFSFDDDVHDKPVNWTEDAPVLYLVTEHLFGEPEVDEDEDPIEQPSDSFYRMPHNTEYFNPKGRVFTARNNDYPAVNGRDFDLDGKLYRYKGRPNEKVARTMQILRTAPVDRYVVPTRKRFGQTPKRVKVVDIKNLSFDLRLFRRNEDFRGCVQRTLGKQTAQYSAA